MPNHYISQYRGEAATEVGHDGSVGVGGVWDPAWNPGSSVLSNGNLTATVNNGYPGSAHGTASMSSGRLYFEGLIENMVSHISACIGIIPEGGIGYPSDGAISFIAIDSGSVSQVIIGTTGAAITPDYGPSVTAGDTIGVLTDFDTLEVTFFKNGVSMGVITGYLRAGVTYHPFISSPGSGYLVSVTANFGAKPFM